MKSISSRQNPWFKRLRAAAAEHDAEIILEGPKQVGDALARGWKPIVIVTRGDVAPASAGGPPAKAGATFAFTPDLFDALAETKTPQNVIALFPRPASSPEHVMERRDTIAVALDNIQDPGNVGTIVRLAAAFDAAGVLLLPGCADPFSPKAIRASVGAALSVPIASTTAAELIASKRHLVVADGAGQIEEPPARDAILVFGNEGVGVSPALRNVAKKIAIRTSGGVESLNVASSAAILLSKSYEARKR